MRLILKTEGLFAVLLIALVTASPVRGQETMTPMMTMPGGHSGQMGMMGPGTMGHGAGGQGMMEHGVGARVVPSQHLSTDDVRHFLVHRLAGHGNQRLKVGEVTKADDDTILADVVTVDGSLVWRFEVDRHSGRLRTVKDTAESNAGMKSMEGTKPMAGMAAADTPVVPPVNGYSEGEKILFLHTETSDPKIAKILTDMMGSPVLVVPSLAKAPEELLARVYVFTNGLKGDGPMGPLGFQPDVFENPPGRSGYSPLRKIALTTWKDAAAARLLKSATEVEMAITNGDLTIEEPGVVVNMPMLTWPKGRR